MRHEDTRIRMARQAMWATTDPRECIECGTENPKRAPCCGVCGGELEGNA